MTPPLVYRGPFGDASARRQLQDLLAADDGIVFLDEAALAIACDEREGVSPEHTRQVLDQLAAGVHFPAGESYFSRVARLSVHLFGSGALKGDEVDYDAPVNSDLPLVLARRRGLPILLSIIMLAVGRRLGLSLVGVGFPGHFLVAPSPLALEAEGVPSERSFWIDPFHGGRMLGSLDLRELLHRRFPNQGVPSPDEWNRLIGPISPKAALVRMNQNLAQSWSRREDHAGLLRAIDRNLLLLPDTWTLHRDRGLLLARLGLPGPAATSLTTYLANNPSAPDVTRISFILSSLAAISRK